MQKSTCHIPKIHHGETLQNFKGKILDDAKKLEEYQITEKGFIVLMITKPKVQPKPAEPKPEPVATPAQETTTPSA